MKRNPNPHRLIMYIIILVGLLLAGVSAILFGVEPIPIALVFGGILAFGGIVYGVIFVRCPFCGKQLNLRGLSADYCPHCGEKFD